MCTTLCFVIAHAANLTVGCDSEGCAGCDNVDLMLEELQAIEGNKGVFSGKVVLDVGSGTGLLAMFAARAGAKKVYAVEASNMANVAQLLVEQNGFSDCIQVRTNLLLCGGVSLTLLVLGNQGTHGKC